MYWIMKEFNENMSKVLDIQLALENYQDNTGQNTNLINEAFGAIATLRQKKTEMVEEERLMASIELLNKLNNVLDVIGREKFIFYEDGGIGYEWDLSLLEGGKNVKG